MAKKITISFKETTKDQELYKMVMDLEDKSVEIKNILRNFLINNNSTIPVVSREIKQVNQVNEDANILDF